MTVELVFGAALAVLAVLFVARPFLRERGAGTDHLDGLAPEARYRLELAEARDQALAALKELELDHRTGKVSDEDYRELVGPLRRRAAEALRALERPVAGEKHAQSPEHVFGTDGGHALDAGRPSR